MEFEQLEQLFRTIYKKVVLKKLGQIGVRVTRSTFSNNLYKKVVLKTTWSNWSSSNSNNFFEQSTKKWCSKQLGQIGVRVTRSTFSNNLQKSSAQNNLVKLEFE